MTENTLQIEQGARFEKAANALNLTQVIVGQSVGFSQGYVSQMMTGARPISKKIFQFIAKKYPQVNIEWILTGNGEMIKQTKLDLVNEQSPVYGSGILETLFNQVQEMEARLQALEKAIKQ